MCYYRIAIMRSDEHQYSVFTVERDLNGRKGIIAEATDKRFLSFVGRIG